MKFIISPFPAACYTKWFKDFWVIWKFRHSRLDLMSFVLTHVYFLHLFIFPLCIILAQKRLKIWICHSYNRKDQKRRHKCSKVLKYQHSHSQVSGIIIKYFFPTKTQINHKNFDTSYVISFTDLLSATVCELRNRFFQWYSTKAHTENW